MPDQELSSLQKGEDDLQTYKTWQGEHKLNIKDSYRTILRHYSVHSLSTHLSSHWLFEIHIQLFSLLESGDMRKESNYTDTDTELRLSDIYTHNITPFSYKSLHRIKSTIVI